MITGEYKGVRYEEIAPGSWRLRWPSGLKSVVSAVDENAVKAMIDGAANG
jgi:hypothetical protein